MISMSQYGVIALVACLIAFAAPAYADSNLEGGALLAHYVTELGFSTDPPAEGWCQAYESYAITSCAEQVNRIDTGSYLPATWFVLAAWVEEKQWCGTEFGFGNYDSSLFTTISHGPCYPGSGMEMPTGGWPGPNEGVACITTSDPWTGTLVPVYYFGGYAYAYAGAGMIPLAEDPATGFAGAANCQTPYDSWEFAELGALGINTDGVAAYPTIPPVGACCIADSCFMRTQQECYDVGGMWYGGTSCEGDENPCIGQYPEAVCCIGDECIIVIAAVCDAWGGTWYELLDSCEMNPCGESPNERITWGRVKSLYR